MQRALLNNSWIAEGRKDITLLEEFVHQSLLEGSTPAPSAVQREEGRLGQDSKMQYSY